MVDEQQPLPEQSQTVRMSAEIDKLAMALSKAQAKITAVVAAEVAKVQTTKGPSYSYKYAHLAAVIEVGRIPLSENQLAVVQLPQCSGGNVVITTMLMHSSGQFIRSDLTLRPDKYTPQAIGSAITYARRYALSAMVGIAPEDDDGKAAEREGDERANSHTPPANTPAAKPATKPKLDRNAHLANAKEQFGNAPDLDTMARWDAAVPGKFPGDAEAQKALRSAATVRFAALVPIEANNMDRKTCDRWKAWACVRGYEQADVDTMTAPLGMRIEELEGQGAGAPAG